MSICLYLLTFANGKQYIGVSSEMDRRLKEHSFRDTLVGRAWRKYGAPAIKILLIGEDDFIYEMERKAVSSYGTLFPDGLNLMEGGKGGRRMSGATRTKMAVSHIGAIMPVEVRAKIGAAKTGHKREPFGPDWCAKLSEAARKSSGFSGRSHSPETRAKMAASQLRRKARSSKLGLTVDQEAEYPYREKAGLPGQGQGPIP